MLPSRPGFPLVRETWRWEGNQRCQLGGSSTVSNGRGHWARNCWRGRSHPWETEGCGACDGCGPHLPRILLHLSSMVAVSFPPIVLSACAQKCVETLHFLRNRGQILLSIQGPLHLAQDSLTSGMKHTFPILSLNAPLCQAGSNQATFFF